MTHKGREITMLESCQNAQERWGGVHLLIDRWLQERHELVRAYDDLGEKPEALSENRKPLQEFCGVLVDYVSAGHFEIYEQLTGRPKPSMTSVGWNWPRPFTRESTSSLRSCWRSTTCAMQVSAWRRSSRSSVACCTSASNWKTA